MNKGDTFINNRSYLIVDIQLIKNMFSLHRHITRTVCGFLPAGRRTSDHSDASAFKNFTVFAFLMEKTIRDKRIFCNFAAD